MNGRIEKWISSQALLTQGYVKHPEKAVGGLLRGMIRAIGENAVVRRFTRYGL